jgi:preprotein translocase subunit SecG
MGAVITVIHVLLCFSLVIVILLQQGKGAEMGATFGGGGSNTLFGSRGAGNFFTKATAIGGALFMLTSVALTKFEVDYTGSSVVEEPAFTETAPAPAPMEGAEMPAMPREAPAEAPVTE